MYQRCYILPKHQYLMNLDKQIKDEHLLWMLGAWCSWTMTNVTDNSGHWCGLPSSDLFCASADPNVVPLHDQQVFYGALTGVTLKLMSNIVPPLNYCLYRNWKREPLEQSLYNSLTCSFWNGKGRKMNDLSILYGH